MGSHNHTGSGAHKGGSQNNPVRVSQTTRGISPSFHSKTSDLGAKNRSTLSGQAYKRVSSGTANHNVSNDNEGKLGSSTAGGGGSNAHRTSAGLNQRPGSAPKMRMNTPNGDN